MAGKNGLIVAQNVLAFFERSGAYDAADEPYRPDEDPRVTVLRYVRGLTPRSNGRVWVSGLTAGELDALEALAQELVDAVGGNRNRSHSEHGDLLAARTVVQHCQRLKPSAPEVSKIVPTAAALPADAAGDLRTPEPLAELEGFTEVDLDPVAALYGSAKIHVQELEEALARAQQQQRQIRQLRDFKIVTAADDAPHLTNAQLGLRFGLDASQVSRIISGQTAQGGGGEGVNLQMG